MPKLSKQEIETNALSAIGIFHMWAITNPQVAAFAKREIDRIAHMIVTATLPTDINRLP